MDDATQLDWLYAHERERTTTTWLSQPIGAGVMRDFTFGEAMGEARCMAAYLRSLDLPAGSRIGLFSKNTAWWLLADVAIWMAGHVTPHERLDKLPVVSEEWTPENGLLTPTLKLRHALIEERYAARVPKLMEREGRVVWM